MRESRATEGMYFGSQCKWFGGLMTTPTRKYLLHPIRDLVR